MIDELDKYEKTCNTASHESSLALTKETSDLIESLESDMIEWEKELKKFTRNVERWVSIHQKAESKYKHLYKERLRIRPSIYTDDLLQLQSRQKIFCKEMFDPIM